MIDVTIYNQVSHKIVFFNYVMAIGIVAFHSKGVQGFNLIDGYDYAIVNNTLDCIGIVSLGFFFLLSGFLLYQNSDSRNERERKIYNRLKVSLLPPFLIWNFIGLIFEVLRLFFIEHKIMSFDLLSVLNGFSFFPYNGPLWYIFALIVLLAVFPILGSVHKKWCWVAVLMVVTMTSYALSVYFRTGGTLYVTWLVRFFHYLPLYLIGAFLGKIYKDYIFEAKYERRVTYCLLGGAFLTLALGLIVFDVHPFLNFLAYNICPLAIWTLLPAKLFHNEPRALYKTSFLLYVFHGILLLPMGVMMKRLYVLIPMTPVAIILAKVLTAILLSFVVYLIYMFFKHFLPSRISVLLLGGRS